MEYHVPSLRDPRLAGKPAPVSSADPPTKAAQADGTTVAAACHGGEALLAPRHTAESAQRTLPALHADGQPANVPESGMPLTPDAAPDRGSQGAKSAQPPILGGTGAVPAGPHRGSSGKTAASAASADQQQPGCRSARISEMQLQVGGAVGSQGSASRAPGGCGDASVPTASQPQPAQCAIVGRAGWQPASGPATYVRVKNADMRANIPKRPLGVAYGGSNLIPARIDLHLLGRDFPLLYNFRRERPADALDIPQAVRNHMRAHLLQTAGERPSCNNIVVLRRMEHNGMLSGNALGVAFLESGSTTPAIAAEADQHAAGPRVHPSQQRQKLPSSTGIIHSAERQKKARLHAPAAAASVLSGGNTAAAVTAGAPAKRSRQPTAKAAAAMAAAPPHRHPGSAAPDAPATPLQHGCAATNGAAATTGAVPMEGTGLAWPAAAESLRCCRTAGAVEAAMPALVTRPHQDSPAARRAEAAAAAVEAVHGGLPAAAVIEFLDLHWLEVDELNAAAMTPPAMPPYTSFPAATGAAAAAAVAMAAERSRPAAAPHAAAAVDNLQQPLPSRHAAEPAAPGSQAPAGAVLDAPGQADRGQSNGHSAARVASATSLRYDGNAAAAGVALAPQQPAAQQPGRASIEAINAAPPEGDSAVGDAELQAQEGWLDAMDAGLAVLQHVVGGVGGDRTNARRAKLATTLLQTMGRMITYSTPDGGRQPV